MTIAFEFIQWGLLLLVGAVTAVNSLVMYRVWAQMRYSLTSRAKDNRSFWAGEIAGWCEHELIAARETGSLDSRPFTQNADLIITALREYARGKP